MPEDLLIRAPAKINLALDVLGRRPDGYHELDTIFQELALADTVQLLPGAEPGIEVTGPRGGGTPAGADNLAWRAFELAAAAAGKEPLARIRLEKHIPPAAGLGGGSSDAAAVLLLAARIWPELEPRLPGLALQLGSDVPYFLQRGTARGRGRGEQLDALPPLARHDVVLFVLARSPEGKTGAVFRALASGALPSPAVPRVLQRLCSGSLRTRDLAGANALESAAQEVFPGLAAAGRTLESVLGEPVCLTGAGPTCFWLGPPGSGPAVAERAAGLAADVIVTSTAP
ncbi:4-(cytidine 5'-diphospho)-2-C-methyl-D-erythritol kinase [Tepidiforma sp.]|uniref:4-(cytidine 5'-diphospho)-2-C-methyl-D-erythritol kinase n=1 Tax=Tepidiforma sp. TaxID=2682230 RepID=UPI002ADE23AE|nr:4-(cytidine 5'-diphospho)-2-C-methyl-D-erythritol kinase [Tepidiforma sp.]